MLHDKLAKVRERVYGEYMRKTPKSKQMYDRACKSLQGGGYSSSRFFAPYPLYMTHAKGSKMYDVDGQEYVDVSNYVPTVGHSHPEVIEAVRCELNRGQHIYNPDFGVEAAELLQEVVPGAERVRFTNSGTEANMVAARTARAFTGKNKIIKFYGHYHGTDDQFLVGTSHPSNEVNCAGIPKEHQINTILLRYNDIDAVRHKLDEDNDIAAVILDPIMTSGGVWPPSHEYLQQLRQLTKKRGVVLIFDEVITGFRIALGGAQEYFGITPDLVTFSKGIASGGKLGVVAGKEEFMAALAPRGVGLSATPAERKLAIQGGYYVDATVALASTIATIKVLKRLNERGEFKKLFQLSEKLKAGIEVAFKRRGAPCHINMLGPVLAIFLTDLEPGFEVYSKLDRTVPGLLRLSLISEGIWVLYGLLLYLSLAHTDADIERIIGAVDNSLDRHKFQELL